jgi:OOP family OmpA-OmpF porin
LIVPTYSRGFSPYLYAGVGGLHYDVTVGASRISPGVEKSGWALYVPGGIGFVSQLSPRLALDFNLGYNYIFSDDINGRRGKEEEKDSYYSGRFGIRIPLGKTGEDREDELLKKKLAEQEQQQKEAQMRLAEEKRQKELQERKAKEEQLKKEQEALEAQKAKEAEKLKEAEKAKEPQKPAEPAMPVVPKPEVAKAEMKFEPVYFPVGGSKLSVSERRKLDQAAKNLQADQVLKLEVAGHTDNSGSLAVNEKLSEARAAAVKAYLVSKGISDERITTKAYAFDQPAADNTTLEGRRLNRRVELYPVK